MELTYLRCILNKLVTQLTHSRVPSFHSQIKLRNRTMIKPDKTATEYRQEVVKTIEGRNIIKTISRSKSRKIIVKKKQRREKGTRDKLWCSKPHSKDVISSRIIGAFSATRRLTNLSKNTKNRLIDRTSPVRNIQLKENLFYKCKLYVLFKLFSQIIV